MTDTVKLWIEERREALRNDGQLIREDRAQDAFHEFPRALDALQAVAELHGPNISKFRVSVWCASECRDSEGNIQQYPCLTVQAIEGAIK